MAQGHKAIYDNTAFDEALSIRILSDFLEQRRTIKTEFSVGDRTPNHDGFMELLDENQEPLKQFIVQIKKVENLKPNVGGRNAGRYTYSLQTAFLAYVKSRVSDNPAIYFVVDVANENKFWLHLTDGVLASLDFEGQETVTYHFEEGDKIEDIDEFDRQLRQIVDDINRTADMTPDQLDAEILRFFVKCFERPAFHDDMHYEGCMEDFDKALADTVTALNTGVHRSLDGRLIRRFFAKKDIHNDALREKIDSIEKKITSIRRKYKRMKQNGQCEENKGNGYIFYKFSDDALPVWFNEKRRNLLEDLSTACTDAGLPPIEFRGTTYDE